MLRCLREHTPSVIATTVPRGGLALWARLPDDADLSVVVSDCRASGVINGSGDEWFPAEPTGNHLCLAYAGAQPSRFEEAARVLERAVRRSSD